MKSSFYSMVRPLILVAIVTLLGPGLVQLAIASPVGTTYEAYLEIPVLAPPGSQGNFEEAVAFDGNPAVLPIDFGPAKDLWITEAYSSDAGTGRETISISISGSITGTPAPLTDNQIDSGGEAILEISGLYWEGSQNGVNLIDFGLDCSFGGGQLCEPIDPDVFIDGDGTLDNPLILSFLFPAAVLFKNLEPSGFENATDLMLTFTVQPVPIPGTLLLMFSGLIGIFAIKRKTRGANENLG